MAKKIASAKRMAPKKRSDNNGGVLERIYQEYLAPMSLEKWSRTGNLSQPSVLKQVPTRTTYSSIGGVDA